jgi:hypothetical protein
MRWFTPGLVAWENALVLFWGIESARPNKICMAVEVIESMRLDTITSWIDERLSRRGGADEE